jgi:hypothetical protein
MTWRTTEAGPAWVPNYGGRAVQREPQDPHRLQTGRPDITHEDLELARQGLPSRTVSHDEILAAQDLMRQLGREGCITYSSSEPGGRLIEAHDNSPEAQAYFEATEELCRQEAAQEWADREAGQ